MVESIHMLIAGLLRSEFLQTSVTLIAGRPMIQSIHMPSASPPGVEGTVACLTFGPVAILIHVLVAVVGVPENIGA